MKIGDKILLENCSDLPSYNGRTGVVLYIDDYGFMKGTWGKELISEEIDEIKKIGFKHLSEKTIKLAEMSSKQAEARQELNSGLKEGILHLIKIYCYRNNEQYMNLYKKSWIGTVYRNISCDVVDKNGKPYLTKNIADAVINANLEDKKFENHFARTIKACEDYDCAINPKDKAGAKQFVSDYLNWAKNVLIEKPEIEKAEVQSKIDSLLISESNNNSNSKSVRG